MPMLRHLTLAAAALVVATIAIQPALAQDCATTMQAIEAALANANLADTDLSAINAALLEAQGQMANGDEAGCMETLQPIAQELGVAQ